MRFTDIYIKRPVLATVISLLILALGLRSLGLLPIRQYPFTENAIVTVSTVYTGAAPDVVAGFITTPLENSIAQVNGIDYMTSTSTQSSSTITVNLQLNYDANKALSEITTKVNAVVNQLPKGSLLPVISISIGQTIDAMYMGFYSEVLQNNQITDYLIRVAQPKLQAVNGVQTAEILGNRQFAMRIWLDPIKMAGYGVTPTNVSAALAANDAIAAVGRTDGSMFTVNLTADTGLTSVEEFKKLIIKASPTTGAIVRIGDVGTVTLGATNYDSSVSFNGKQAIYIGIQVAPTANLLTVIDAVKKSFIEVQQQLPKGLHAEVVYDSTKFVNSAIHEVLKSLFEALMIVTIVTFLFLGSVRSVTVPVIAIPLSLIGAFFIMFLLGYSINLLTLLALVLAIGLVVDDAIIVVENVQRHMEEGMSKYQAALQGARELANPIIAITVVLIAVYVPIGFMGGLTGALFSEFAFTLAGAVAVSAVIALTLSPMMCSKILKISDNGNNKFLKLVDHQFHRLEKTYHRVLHNSLNTIIVTGVFAVIILTSIYFLYSSSKSELAPMEDQGIIISQVITAPNATLAQTQLYSNTVTKIYMGFPEADRVFQLDGISGLNSSIIGMGLKPWEERKRTSNQLQPLLQDALDKLSGATAAVFQLPPLPGARGVPIQFVIKSTDPFPLLNEVSQTLKNKALASGIFLYLDTDLKIDKAQTNIVVNRDKAAQFGMTMQDVSSALGGALSQGYINYFNFAGRSYQVIPQMIRDYRQNANQILNYYLQNQNQNGTVLSLGSFATLKSVIVPESLNHFQQLNSATISAVYFPGLTMGEVLNTLNKIAKEVLPQGYAIDYGGQSRQFIQEGSALIATFFFALIIIFLSLAALFESFRDPLIILISVPMSICGALIFICLGVGGATLNIYTEVGLVTLIGLISKHGILIVQFANDLQEEGKSKREAIEMAAGIRLRPILMTTAAMVLGVVPLLTATGAGAVSRFSIGLVIATGISIGTLFTLFVVPAMYMLLADDYAERKPSEDVEGETLPVQS